MTAGNFQKEYSIFGHGTKYFKSADVRYKETFANLFALRSSPEWEVVKRKMPALAKQFDEIMKGAA